MTIASAFNDIAVAQGGTASSSGTIAGAIDALNDALAGSDQESCQTIEGAVRLLGEHIGGGGSSVTVEALTATENKTYTAPEGKAYSPVTVNVAGGGSTEYDIKCYTKTNDTLEEIESLMYPVKIVEVTDGESTYYDFALDKSGGAISSAEAGAMIGCDYNEVGQDDYNLYPNASYSLSDSPYFYVYYPFSTSGDYTFYLMPNNDCAFVEIVA